MNSVISHIITFLGGLLIGIFGNYIANRWTEKSKLKESKKNRRKEFIELKEKMPDLFNEIKEDLKNQDFHNCRELFVSPNRGVVVNHTTPVFFYYEDEHKHLRSNIRILEQANFIIDITPGNLPKFQFQEEFVKLILEQ